MTALEYIRSVRGERTEAEIAKAIGSTPEAVGAELLRALREGARGVIMLVPTDGSPRQFVAVFCREWAPRPDLRPMWVLDDRIDPGAEAGALIVDDAVPSFAPTMVGMLGAPRPEGEQASLLGFLAPLSQGKIEPI